MSTQTLFLFLVSQIFCVSVCHFWFLKNEVWPEVYYLVSCPHPTLSWGEIVWWAKLNFLGWCTLLQQYHLATFKHFTPNPLKYSTNTNLAISLVLTQEMWLGSLLSESAHRLGTRLDNTILPVITMSVVCGEHEEQHIHVQWNSSIAYTIGSQHFLPLPRSP